MSKRILVIDDEPLIAAGLSEKIEWAQVDCHIVGTATNGADGLRLIEELSPDIVISDIVMPGYSGIELAEHCFHEHPAIKLILLSAYSEFEYAQQAIRYNVVEYVLKPIDSRKLLEAVGKAVSLLEEQNRLSCHMRQLESVAEDAQRHLSSSILFEVARHGEGALREGERDIPDRPGVVLCVRLYNIRKDAADSARLSARDAFHSRLERDGVQAYVENHGEEIVFLCCLHGGIDHETSRRRILQSVDQALESLGGDPGQDALVAVCQLSRPYRDAAGLRARYRECMKALPRAFFCRQSCALLLDALPQTPEGTVGYGDILHHLHNGNTEALLEALRRALGEIEALGDRDLAVNFLKDLYRHASAAGSKAGMSLRPVGASGYLAENFARKSREVEEYLVAVCRYIASSNDFVSRLELLVEENYGDRKFGLNAAADIMGISSSYLSRLFKKKNDQNFIDYLLNKRIDRAKYLLETTGLRNRQIAERVGFDSDRYFGQVFKKYCGITPGQYRESVTEAQKISKASK